MKRTRPFLLPATFYKIFDLSIIQTMSFDEREARFDINEFEIDEEGRRRDPEARVKIPQMERAQERESKRERRARKRQERASRPKKYNWAFFVACCCFGMIGPVAANEPGTIFLGAGIGFLFFVDPIYERVISVFERE